MMSTPGTNFYQYIIFTLRKQTHFFKGPSGGRQGERGII